MAMTSQAKGRLVDRACASVFCAATVCYLLFQIWQNAARFLPGTGGLDERTYFLGWLITSLAFGGAYFLLGVLILVGSESVQSASEKRRSPTTQPGRVLFVAALVNVLDAVFHTILWFIPIVGSSAVGGLLFWGFIYAQRIFMVAAPLVLMVWAYNGQLRKRAGELGRRSRRNLIAAAFIMSLSNIVFSIILYGQNALGWEILAHISSSSPFWMRLLDYANWVIPALLLSLIWFIISGVKLPGTWKFSGK